MDITLDLHLSAFQVNLSGMFVGLPIGILVVHGYYTRFTLVCISGEPGPSLGMFVGLPIGILVVLAVIIIPAVVVVR
jgi:hypothetical protein